MSGDGVGDEGRRYAEHLVRTAVRSHMRVEQYNTSAEFKYRMDMLERFLAMALPELPVDMTTDEEFLWVRRMVEVLAEEAVEEERRAEILRQAIEYGKPAVWHGGGTAVSGNNDVPYYCACGGVLMQPPAEYVVIDNYEHTRRLCFDRITNDVFSPLVKEEEQ